MAKKQRVEKAEEINDVVGLVGPLVAAGLTAVVYQAKLMNRQSKLNIPEHEVISEVVTLWHTLMKALSPTSI